MTNKVLELRGIVRSYEQGGRTLRVLDNVNLQLNSGEVVALVGPSGSGKSTLLQIAGLLDTPTSGEVVLGGVSMTAATDALRTQARGRSIGFVYQQHHLLPEFSALENVMLPQLVQGVSASQAREHAASLLAQLGLSERMKHRPAALSGGEQQRVAIARALANQPSLVLADEPTGNLDPATAESVFEILVRAAREKHVAMLLATHNIDMAQRMDRIIKVA